MLRAKVVHAPPVGAEDDAAVRGKIPDWIEFLPPGWKVVRRGLLWALTANPSLRPSAQINLRRPVALTRHRGPHQHRIANRPEQLRLCPRDDRRNRCSGAPSAPSGGAPRPVTIPCGSGESSCSHGGITTRGSWLRVMLRVRRQRPLPSSSPRQRRLCLRQPRLCRTAASLALTATRLAPHTRARHLTG